MKNNNNMYVLYFYCTPYKESSAGVRTIYTMIDFYNKNNQPAFILYQNETIGAGGYSNSSSTSNMSTPVLTNELLDQHVKNNKIPIIIYPDTVSGNPLKAKNVCRIVLYYDGVFTKKSCLKNSKNEGLIYFSKQIKDKAEVKSALYEHIISFPVADEKILNGLNEKLERTEEYYYDGKYSKNFGGTIPDNIKKLKKIDRGYHDSLTQAKIFNKLKTAKVLHVFEDTALIYESLLLGCPVNIHPKGYFYEDKPLGSNEVNLYGSISKTKISEDIMEIKPRNY